MQKAIYTATFRIDLRMAGMKEDTGWCMEDGLKAIDYAENRCIRTLRDAGIWAYGITNSGIKDRSSFPDMYLVSVCFSVDTDDYERIRGAFEDCDSLHMTELRPAFALMTLTRCNPHEDIQGD